MIKFVTNFLIAMGLGLILMPVAKAQETDFSSIKTNWKVCSTCHGTNGEGKPGFPNVRVLEQAYIIEALSDYKNNIYRGDQSGIMFSMAATLTDEQIELLSKYITEELTK